MVDAGNRSACLSFSVALCLLIWGGGCVTTSSTHIISSVPAVDAEAFDIDTSFYSKFVMAEGIRIVSSDKVQDEALLETAYLFDHLMQDLNPDICQRVKDHGVVVILIGYEEPVSSLPGFETDKTGNELERYNWRQRGFLTERNNRKVAVFSEESVLEYRGGNRLESILIHEFGHVVHKAGFPEDYDERLKQVYKHAMDNKLWHDGRAAQRFRVKSQTPVRLLESLKQEFTFIPPALIEACVASGDVTVNGTPTHGDQDITRDDAVLIVFGGPKKCYATTNRGEYFAEMYQTWYDTNRTDDHDHNHITTRDQLKEYDIEAAAFLQDVTAGSEWRFIPVVKRAGKAHLKGYDPEDTPTRRSSPALDDAAKEYWDKYWKPFWPRLAEKHGIPLDT